jgi:hypothetical protein
MDQTPINKLLDALDWQTIEGTPPASGERYATHQGILVVGSDMLRCYQLDDGTRLIDAEDLAAFFGVYADDGEEEDDSSSRE